VVLLDIDGNQYYTVQKTINELFSDDIYGVDAEENEDEIVKSLIDLGILIYKQRSDNVIPISPSCTQPVSGLEILRNVKAHRITVISAVFEQIICGITVKLRPLSKILGNIKKAKNIAAARCTPGVGIDVIEIAASFQTSSLFISFKDKCLPRSLALVRYLSKRGVLADLIIGVKMRPFAAHAWVEHRGFVLNDTVDGVQPYTPILVV
jgi:hypothetical protein